jgi:hypothetical protein
MAVASDKEPRFTSVGFSYVLFICAASIASQGIGTDQRGSADNAAGPVNFTSAGTFTIVE